MAIAVAIKKKTKLYDTMMVVAEVTFDDSYPTGGEPLAPAALGLSKIDILVASPNSGYVFEYDHANSKLKAYQGDNDAVADGPLVQVADKADLKTVKSYIMAFGRPL